MALIAIDLEGAAVPHLDADIEPVAAGRSAARDFRVRGQVLRRADIVAGSQAVVANTHGLAADAAGRRRGLEGLGRLRCELGERRAAKNRAAEQNDSKHKQPKPLHVTPHASNLDYPQLSMTSPQDPQRHLLQAAHGGAIIAGGGAIIGCSLCEEKPILVRRTVR